jgi:hypothetical protein
MATKITLTLDENLNPIEKEMTQQFLYDAIGEFISQRHPADRYVAKRYGYNDRPEIINADKVRYAAKVAKVEGRLLLATKIRKAIISVTRVEDE